MWPSIELALKGKKIQLLALLYYWFVVVFEVKIVFCSESAAASLHAAVALRFATPYLHAARASPNQRSASKGNAMNNADAMDNCSVRHGN